MGIQQKHIWSKYSKILLCDDAEQRGIEKANFTVICECGRISREIWDKLLPVLQGKWNDEWRQT